MPVGVRSVSPRPGLLRDVYALIGSGGSNTSRKCCRWNPYLRQIASSESLVLLIFFSQGEAVSQLLLRRAVWQSVRRGRPMRCEDAELPTVQPRGFAHQHPTPSGTEPVFPKVHLARRAPHPEGPGPSPSPQAYLREERGTQTERSVFSWSLLTLSSRLDVSAGCQIASQEPRGTGRRAPVHADRGRQDLFSLSLTEPRLSPER